ncbi:DUF4352 domain-containing protein [Frankia sp. AgPm24]|uniref:DUF4352 domain-containing protein n=1 Tax=Frankia umida TaxID=573489 RepID=A0ABT0K378_9ACTN|nr:MULTISPECIES: DUF4352 domain-containing protein [Frankia]MCK9877743.1 DUF4352 domain-containing protein [Frankia umida]MCK9922957.1 DUF4352 domain-containing protein [Frankia sp. AgPm24]
MRKARLFVLVGVLVGMVGLTGCLEDTSVTATGATAAPGQSGGSGGSGSGGAAKAQYGQVLEIRKDGAVAATVSVAAPQAVSSFFGGFTKPTSGPAFATFLVSFTAQKQGFTVNAFDFYVRTPDGARAQPAIGCEPQFSAATLSAGEKYQGCLTFDAPHGSLVYASNLFTSTSLAEWPSY